MLAIVKQCLAFLTKAERWRWAGVIPLGVIAAVMEALGAVAVFALIKIIDNPSRVTTLPVVSQLFPLLPWQGRKAAVLTATAAVALFYLLKNFVLAASAYVQNTVVHDSIATLSRQMLKGYFTIPFAFHFRRNSAELIRNTADSPDLIFRLVMAPAVAVVSEALIILAIVGVLTATARSSTLLAVLVLSGLLAALLRLTGRIVSRWGADEQELRRATLQTLKQSLGALKEVKVMGRERFFYDLFSGQQDGLARVRSQYATLAFLPRLLVETLFITGMLLVIMVVTVRSKARSEIVPVLGLYAYAGFRIIPSVNRILMHLHSIRYGSKAVEQLHDDFLTFKHQAAAEVVAPDGTDITFADRLAVEHVSYAYDPSRPAVLQDISLVIHRGESIGIVGPTGAGKTTLIDIILGLLQPSAGRVTADGTDVFSALRLWQRKIGYVPQFIYLTDDNLRRNIAFGITDTDIDERKVQAAVHMAQLEDFVASLPHGLDTTVGERGVRLSGGERQRVAIARALYHDPELLVLDEATAALDNQTEHDVARAIEALHGEKSMIIIAHRLSTVRNCDRLVFLRNGRVEGCAPFDELLAHNANFRTMASLAEEGGATL